MNAAKNMGVIASVINILRTHLTIRPIFSFMIPPLSELNDNLSKIGTIVTGTKLNAGKSVAINVKIELAKITLSPGTWVVICDGWNPIGIDSILELEGYVNTNSLANTFNMSHIINLKKTSTIKFAGTSYSTSTISTVLTNYDFMAVRIA